MFVYFLITQLEKDLMLWVLYCTKMHNNMTIPSFIEMGK